MYGHSVFAMVSHTVSFQGVSMKNLKINIVNAHKLDPDKKYILELPSDAYSIDDAQNIADAIYKEGIKGFVMVSRGDKHIKIIEVTE